MAETHTTYRLIVKKYMFVPVQGKMYRRTEILEEVITSPYVHTIDLTNDSSEPNGSSAPSEPSESITSDELLRGYNTPTYCECAEHRDYIPLSPPSQISLHLSRGQNVHD